MDTMHGGSDAWRTAADTAASGRTAYDAQTNGWQCLLSRDVRRRRTHFSYTTARWHETASLLLFLLSPALYSATTAGFAHTRPWPWPCHCEACAQQQRACAHASNRLLCPLNYVIAAVASTANQSTLSFHTSQLEQAPAQCRIRLQTAAASARGGSSPAR